MRPYRLGVSMGTHGRRRVPRDYVRKPRRWPDGPIDRAAAVADNRFAVLQLLRDAALNVREARTHLGMDVLTQEALSRRANLYDDAVNRLERGGAWVDLNTLVSILDAAGLRLEVVDAQTGEPPTWDAPS
jgi:hypothetical protein